MAAGWAHSVPQGRPKIARQFIAGTQNHKDYSVPQGRPKIARQFIAGTQNRKDDSVPQGRPKYSATFQSVPTGLDIGVGTLPRQ